MQFIDFFSCDFPLYLACLVYLAECHEFRHLVDLQVNHSSAESMGDLKIRSTQMGRRCNLDAMAPKESIDRSMFEKFHG